MADEKIPIIDAEERANLPKISECMDQKLFRCKNCSSESDGQVWWSWNEASKEPVPKGEKRTLLKCKTCKQTLGIYSLDNQVDVSALPKEIQDL